MENNKDLIEKSKKGNQRAQYRLYKLYARPMYNVSYRIMRNKELAEDMLQESFSQAFMALDTFRYDSSFGSWLKMILVNKCINELKKRRVELIFTNDLQHLSTDNDDYGEYESSLNVEEVKNAMEELPPGAKVIFSLYLLEGYDHQEISQILNISESASRSQYSRAKSKIRELLMTRKQELESDSAFDHINMSFATGLSRPTTNNAVPQHI